MLILGKRWRFLPIDVLHTSLWQNMRFCFNQRFLKYADSARLASAPGDMGAEAKYCTTFLFLCKMELVFLTSPARGGRGCRHAKTFGRFG